MTLNIPPEIPSWVVAAVAGPWPKGDEDALRRLGHAWIALGEAITKISHTTGEARRRALTVLEGKTANALKQHGIDLDADLGEAAKACHSLGEQCLHDALYTEFGKYVIVGSLAALAIQLTVDLLVPGVGQVQATAATTATRLTVRAAFRDLIANLGADGARAAAARFVKVVLFKGATMGAIQGGLIPLGADVAQMMQHNRKSGDFDWEQIGLGVVAGAAAGAAGEYVGGRAMMGLERRIATDGFAGRTTVRLVGAAAGGGAGAVAAVAAIVPFTGKLELGWDHILPGIVGGALGSMPHALRGPAGPGTPAAGRGEPSNGSKSAPEPSGKQGRTPSSKNRDDQPVVTTRPESKARQAETPGAAKSAPRQEAAAQSKSAAQKGIPRQEAAPASKAPAAKSEAAPKSSVAPRQEAAPQAKAEAPQAKSAIPQQQASERPIPQQRSDGGRQVSADSAKAAPARSEAAPGAAAKPPQSSVSAPRVDPKEIPPTAVREGRADLAAAMGRLVEQHSALPEAINSAVNNGRAEVAGAIDRLIHQQAGAPEQPGVQAPHEPSANPAAQRPDEPSLGETQRVRETPDAATDSNAPARVRDEPAPNEEAPPRQQIGTREPAEPQPAPATPPARPEPARQPEPTPPRQPTPGGAHEPSPARPAQPREVRTPEPPNRATANRPRNNETTTPPTPRPTRETPTRPPGEVARPRNEPEAPANRRTEEAAAARRRGEAEVATRRRATEEAAARRRAEEEAATRRRAEEEAATRRAEEEAAAARARTEEEAAARRRVEEEAARRRTAEEEAAARRRAEEEAATRRRAEEEAATRRAEEEAAAARARTEEEAATRRRVEEEAARRRTAEEEAAARRRAEEEAATRRRAEEEAATRRAEEEAAAARARTEEEAATRRRVEEESARRRTEEEAAARRRAEEEAAAARRRAEEEAAARRTAEEAAARRRADEEAATRRRTEEEAAARRRAEEEAATRRRAEEEAATRRAEEEAAAARARTEEEAAARRTAEEAAARRRADEEAATRRRTEEEAANRRRAEEAAARRRAEEEAARARAEEEAAARRRAEEEAAARRRAEEEAAARRRADDEARRTEALLERVRHESESLIKELEESRYAMREKHRDEVRRYQKAAQEALARGDWNSYSENLAKAREVLKSARETYREGDLQAKPGFSNRKLVPRLLGREQRRFTKDEYIEKWEHKLGRKITPEELRTIERGCIGVSMAGLGRENSQPPMHMAFDDPAAHAKIAAAQKALAAGEAATGKLMGATKELRRQRFALKKALEEPGATETSPEVVAAKRKVEKATELVEKYKTEAREEWRKISAEAREEHEANRNEGKIEGGERTFERVSDYTDRLNQILASKPESVAEFMAKVEADPVLSQLKGIEASLPKNGKPSEWEAVIFSKHFWSGEDGISPAPERFTPDPTTGQVDMSGKRALGRDGYINFDYGLYDKRTNSWLHANHFEPKTAEQKAVYDPMEVLQSSHKKFYSSYVDFDSAVICIAFVRKA